jgi:hypothetical protein
MSKYLIALSTISLVAIPACMKRDYNSATNSNQTPSASGTPEAKRLPELKATNGERIALEYAKTEQIGAPDSRSTSTYALSTLISVYANCDRATAFEAHIFAEFCPGCYPAQTTPWNWQGHEAGVRKIRLDKQGGAHGTCTFQGTLDKIFISGSGYGYGIQARQQIAIYKLGTPVDGVDSWLKDPISGTHNFIFDLTKAQ